MYSVAFRFGREASENGLNKNGPGYIGLYVWVLSCQLLFKGIRRIKGNGLVEERLWSLLLYTLKFQKPASVSLTTLYLCTLICLHADMFPVTMVIDWSSETVSMLPTECFLRLSLAIVCLHNNKVILVLSENLLVTIYPFITNFQGTQPIRLCSWRSEWPEYWQADPPKEKAHPPYEGKTIRCTYWLLSFHHTVPRVPLSSQDLWPWAQGIGDVYTASFSWLLAPKVWHRLMVFVQNKNVLTVHVPSILKEREGHCLARRQTHERVHDLSMAWQKLWWEGSSSREVWWNVHKQQLTTDMAGI